MPQGKRQAGVLTKEAYDRAFDVLLEYEPDTGITLPELLTGIFKSAGFEFPDAVSLENTPRFFRQLVETNSELMQISD